MTDRGKLKYFNRTLVLQTPAGFKVEVKLEGHLKVSGDVRVEGAVYRKEDVFPPNAPVLKQEDFDPIERSYLSQFKDFLKRSNRFYAFGWTSPAARRRYLAEPHVWDYQLQNEGQRIALDLNGVDCVRAANREINFQENGCTVHLNIVDSGIWSNELKEENFRMIDDPKILQQVKGDERYRMYDEVTAVAATMKQLEMEKEYAKLEKEFADRKAGLAAQEANQKHGQKAHVFSIETTLIDNALKITWKRKSGYENSKIIGYCIQARGFPERRYETRGEYNVFVGYTGQQIVEAWEDGDRVLPVVPGSELGFTFVLQRKKGLFGGKLEDFDYIQFAVAVPVPKPEQDREQQLRRTIAIEKLEAQLRNMRQPKEERDEADEVVRKLLKEIKTAERAEDTLMNLQHERERSVAETARNQAKAGGLVGEQAEEFVREKVARVKDFYDDLRTKYL